MGFAAGAGVAAAPLRPSAAAAVTHADVERVLAMPSVPLTDVSPGDGETTPDPEPGPLLDHLDVALPCGTPVARAAAAILPSLDAARRDDVQRLLVPPRLAAPRAFTPTDEPFVVLADLSAVSRHAVSRRDADRNRIPDAAEALGDEIRFTLARAQSLLGWSGPAAGTLRVALAASLFPEGRFVDGPAPFIVVPSRMPPGTARLGAVAHQLGHAAARELAADAPPEWEEAVATWFSREVVAAAADDDTHDERSERDERNDGADVPPGLEAPPPSRALLSPGLLASRGDAAFLRFIATRPDAPSLALPEGWMGDLLVRFARRLDAQRVAARDSAPAQAMANATTAPSPAAARLTLTAALDEALAARGTTLAEAVSAFHLARLEDELLARGARTPVDADLRGLPSEDSRSADDAVPFGQHRFGIDTPFFGGLALAFESGWRHEAVAVALLDDGSILRYPLDGRPSGTALRLPGSRLARVIVQVVMPHAPADGRSFDPATAALAASDGGEGFRLRALPDEGHPFILDDISGIAAAGRVTMDWTTRSETDVLGWLIERSLRPAGPFSALSRIPFPANGGPRAASGYAFVDTDVRPATRYHYRVVALTASGLGEPSPVVTVRTLPAVPTR